MNCPVCGYPNLRNAQDFEICPSCGTEFGYHDHRTSHAELRNAWVRNGMQWSSRYTQKPKDWSPYWQLTAAGLRSDVLVADKFGPITSTAHAINQTNSSEVFELTDWIGASQLFARR